jgi:hypothetical protein
MKQRLIDWYNQHIVKGWYRTWTVWAAALAVALPELIQVAIDNADTFFMAVPVLDDTSKAQLRVLLIVIIPIVRALKQPTLPKE